MEGHLSLRDGIILAVCFIGVAGIGRLPIFLTGSLTAPLFGNSGKARERNEKENQTGDV